MTRLNIVLLLAVLASALYLVNVQYQSRRLYTELERANILRVLELCENQKTKAAALLGINRTTLWKKLRQYGLE